MSEDTEYIEGSHSDFILYLFGNEPKPRDTIVLESPSNDISKNRYLHIFEQLLQIFVDGLKYKYSKNTKINISHLSQDNLNEMKEYFKSFGFYINLKIYNGAMFLKQFQNDD